MKISSKRISFRDNYLPNIYNTNIVQYDLVITWVIEMTLRHNQSFSKSLGDKMSFSYDVHNTSVMKNKNRNFAAIHRGLMCYKRCVKSDLVVTLYRKTIPKTSLKHLRCLCNANDALLRHSYNMVSGHLKFRKMKILLTIHEYL